MVRNVLLLISITLEDGVEGVITNDLSETFESNRFDNIVNICWRNLESNSSDLIDWDIDVLRVLLEGSIIWSLGGNEAMGSWSILWLLSESCGGLWCFDFLDLNSSLVLWLLGVMLVVFVVLFVVVFGNL